MTQKLKTKVILKTKETFCRILASKIWSSRERQASQCIIAYVDTQHTSFVLSIYILYYIHIEIRSSLLLYGKLFPLTPTQTHVHTNTRYSCTLEYGIGPTIKIHAGRKGIRVGSGFRWKMETSIRISSTRDETVYEHPTIAFARTLPITYTAYNLPPTQSRHILHSQPPILFVAFTQLGDGGCDGWRCLLLLSLPARSM